MEKLDATVTHNAAISGPALSKFGWRGLPPLAVAKTQLLEALR